MNTKLWVDDIRNPPDDTYDVVRTYNDAILALMATEYTDIYLDHDLACFSKGREMTGYDVVLWIVDQHINNPDNFTAPVRYHMLTANPVGRKNMTELINRYLLTAD
jgi:hypothetical protein